MCVGVKLPWGGGGGQAMGRRTRVEKGIGELLALPQRALDDLELVCVGEEVLDGLVGPLAVMVLVDGGDGALGVGAVGTV